MPRSLPPYPPELRQMAKAERDARLRNNGLTTEVRMELNQLRHENRASPPEREML